MISNVITSFLASSFFKVFPWEIPSVPQKYIPQNSFNILDKK